MIAITPEKKKGTRGEKKGCCVSQKEKTRPNQNTFARTISLKIEGKRKKINAGREGEPEKKKKWEINSFTTKALDAGKNQTQ